MTVIGVLLVARAGFGLISPSDWSTALFFFLISRFVQTGISGVPGFIIFFFWPVPSWYLDTLLVFCFGLFSLHPKPG